MSAAAPLVVLLNGPLGIGKSTLGDILGEALDGSLTLDGDSLSALNPPPADKAASLHSTIALIVRHHLASGYDRFVINHYWSSAAQIADLEERLRAVAPGVCVRCFRLTLSREANLQRIARRQSVRAIDEEAFEAEHFAEEHALLSAAEGDALGTPFDVSDPPEVLAARLLDLLGIAPTG